MCDKTVSTTVLSPQCSLKENSHLLLQIEGELNMVNLPILQLLLVTLGLLQSTTEEVIKTRARLNSNEFNQVGQNHFCKAHNMRS